MFVVRTRVQNILNSAIIICSRLVIGICFSLLLCISGILVPRASYLHTRKGKSALGSRMAYLVDHYIIFTVTSGFACLETGDVCFRYILFIFFVVRWDLQLYGV